MKLAVRAVLSLCGDTQESHTEVRRVCSAFRDTVSTDLAATQLLVYPTVPHLEGAKVKGACTLSTPLLDIVSRPSLGAWGHSLVGRVLASHAEVLGLGPALYMLLNMVVHAYNSTTEEVETGGLQMIKVSSEKGI